MKSLVLASALTLSFAANAHLVEETNSNIRYVGDTEYAGFCKAVIEDNVAMFKSKLAHKVGTIAPSRRAVLKKLTSEEGMSCNGESLVDFSKQYNATQVNAYLTSAI